MLLSDAELEGGASEADYTGLPESVTFAPGQTAASFTVTATDDTADDDGESIRFGIGYRLVLRRADRDRVRFDVAAIVGVAPRGAGGPDDRAGSAHGDGAPGGRRRAEAGDGVVRRERLPGGRGRGGRDAWRCA